MKDLLFLPVKILLIAIDLLLTIVTFGWLGIIRKITSTDQLRTVPVADDESHRVDPRFRAQLITTPRPGMDTLYDITKVAFERFGSRHCMGTRHFLGWRTPKIKEFGPDTTWKTYAQVGQQANQFGAALRSAGVQPAPYSTTLEQVTTPCRIAIFENTCAEWMIAAMGAFTQSVTVTTVYATLGMDAVAEAVVDNIIPVIVCNRKDVSRLAQKCSSMPSLKYIVYTDDLVAPNETIEMPKAPKGVTIVSFDEFCASGDTKAYPPTPPKADSCAVLMYTSGSTGKPKGVIVTHRQIVGACAAGDVALQVVPGGETYLAYLPLAHILELMAEFLMITMGCTLCYADPKSLSATGAYPIGALEQFSPTIMVAVPKIWDTIKKGIEAKVHQASPVAQMLVETGFAWRSFALKHGFDTPLFKALVFKKFAKVVGGQLRLAVSGGGPLNTEVQDFIRAAFGVTFIQGYGLTETCAGLTIQDFTDTRGNIAGVPIASVEVKLESTPDVGDKAGQSYLSTDRRDVEGNPIFGRGEIVVRGSNITCGYYMMAEKSKDEFKEDGWFHTGDIGQFMADGSIRIVDRKKNLVKLKGGEYIALEKMEMTYGNSKFVDAVQGGICCYGDGDMDRPIAIMQLSQPYTTKWAQEKGLKGDWEELKTSKEVYNAVLDDMKKEHAKSDLSHLEKLVAVALLDSPWTPENGCLTAANKLQRRAVIQQFEKEFEDVKKKGIF
jgi:long-chain acyl-CoA synthetase